MKKIFLILPVLTLLLSIVIVSAAPTEKTSAFVCPVFNEDSMAGMKNPNAFAIGEGHYSIAPGKAFTHPDGPVNVPIHATNGDGAGSPPGPHSQPGDSDYSAIWAA